MVTNNTMLLFKRLYNNSTERFNRFLNAILKKYLLNNCIDAGMRLISFSRLLEDNTIQSVFLKL